MDRTKLAVFTIAPFVTLVIGVTQPAQQSSSKFTAEQDHQAMLALLNISNLRPGADGFNKAARNFQNIDESRAEPYNNYPDVLVLKDGKAVKTLKDWAKRRGELFEDFDREVYGRLPKHTPKVQWELTGTSNEKVGEWPVVTKHLTGHVDNSAFPDLKVDIQLTLTTPADSKASVPVILEFGFTFPSRRPGAVPTPAQRPQGQGRSWQEQVLEKGYGYAVMSPNSFQADNGAGLTQGVIGLVNKGKFRKADDWGALRAWAWGASRALDYFEADKAVDAKRVAIEGISRYGKAALVTMAYDPRFAAAFVGSSGAGGAKLWRRNFGETEGNIAGTGEYHWMAGNFIKYAGPMTPGDLPVDSHELIALCAPRPVFVSCGSPNSEGTWVDDRGMFLATRMASPVWELLGKRGIGGGEMPAEENGLLDGELAWRQHSGGHTNGPNWPSFLKWVSRYFDKPK